MTLVRRTEQIVQRRQTRAMIDNDPSEIVLKRQTKTRNHSNGAVITVDDELPPQRMRILPPYVSRRGRQNEPYDETLKMIPYSKETLMCLWTADIERGDTFVHEGSEYRVSFVYNNREYEILANIETTQSAA